MARLTMPRPVPTLAGETVTLRPLDPPGDAADYYEWNLDPEMHVWTGNRPPASVEEARAELERFAGMDDVTMWAVVDNASGKMVGRFFVRQERRDGELIVGEGNRIAKAYWRKGHNREARQLVFEYVFEVLEADAYETGCWAENVNSRASIEAHGFTFLAERDEYNDKYGRAIPKRFYRMTRDQWRKLSGSADP